MRIKSRLTANHHKALKWMLKQTEPRNPMEAGLIPFWAFQSLATKGYASVKVDAVRGNLFSITDIGRQYIGNVYGVGNA